ncbi:MAG: hypothetical protein K2N82_09230 [Lachnospiraceae bacterium]|nr:hypothetical protein [Lachnospiraceae bacterium]
MDSSNTQDCDHAKAYREEFKKPLEEIKEDIFFRADNFEGEAWYGDLMLYMRIGVCQPEQEHIPELQKALKIMGYHTHIMENGEKPYLVPGDSSKTQKKEKSR